MSTAFMVLLAALLGVSAPGPAGPATSFKVIAHPGVPGKRIARETLAQIYLGKVARWGDGRPIEAVDLSAMSRARQAFSVDVLGMSVEGVRHYWLRALSAGKRPPPTKASDADVISFVASTPGGVGYVSDAAETPSTVRVVPVQ